MPYSVLAWVCQDDIKSFYIVRSKRGPTAFVVVVEIETVTKAFSNWLYWRVRRWARTSKWFCLFCVAHASQAILRFRIYFIWFLKKPFFFLSLLNLLIRYTHTHTFAHICTHIIEIRWLLSALVVFAHIHTLTQAFVQRRWIPYNILK